MRRQLAAVALLSMLAGCASLDPLFSASVSPQSVIVAANSFDAIEATATNYLKLPTCSATSGLICKVPAAVAQIVPAIRSGRTARNSLEALLAANANASIPVARYKTLTTAISTLQAIVNQYSLKG